MHIVPLSKDHDRTQFTCGKAPLDNYIRRQVSQDVKRKLATCFVLPDDDNKVIGYYTLSSAGIPRDLVPESISKRLPRAYSELPVTLLGRLAIDKHHLNKGYGKIMLVNALQKSLTSSKNIIASAAVVVDPIDDEAIAFYKYFGFISLEGSDRMFMAMATIAQGFE